MTPTHFVPARRTAFPVWVTIPALALAYGVGVPVTKALGALGQWPDIVVRHRRRRAPPFPDFGTYRPDGHDVVAASYFKSGTNLVMQMTVQIAGRGRAEYDHIHDLVAWPDAPKMAEGYAIPVEDETPWRNSPTELRVIKTHLGSRKIPLTDAARYIAVVRDPKSVCVSGYIFTKALIFGPLMPSLESWARFFMGPDFIFGNWAEHLAGFWALRSQPNVLFTTYEDITKDLPAAVRRFADFMGVALSSEELDSVARQSSFAHMKAIARKFDYIKTAPWSKPEGATIRKGRRGSSNELLSAKLQAQIDDHFRAELRRLGCDFPYDRAFATPG